VCAFVCVCMCLYERCYPLDIPTTSYSLTQGKPCVSFEGMVEEVPVPHPPSEKKGEVRYESGERWKAEGGRCDGGCTEWE
jgi:hypothetical protein